MAATASVHAQSTIQFQDADGTLRTWTVDNNTTPDPGSGGQYNPPQSNSYVASGDQLSGTMTGRFGIDSAMVTPVTIAVGSMISYDYKLTNEQRNFRGTGASNWVGDSYGDFRGTFGDPFIGYLISGRAGYQYDFASDRVVHFQDAGFNLSPIGYSGATEDTAGIRIRWTFFADSGVGQDNYYVTVTNIGETTPLAYFRGSTGGNPATSIGFFRQGANDTEQDVTLSNFYQYATSPTPSGNSFSWNAASGSYNTGGNWSAGSPAGTPPPTLADNAVIANGGTATVNTSGPNAAGAVDLDIGNASGNGTLEVVTGGELLVANIIRLGNSTGTGTINQSGGLVRLLDNGNDDLRIGFDAGGTGNYNLSGGELAVGDSFTTGHLGTGTFTMTGGLVSQAGFMTVGRSSGSNGTFNMSGGAIFQTFGDLEVGNFGTGTANLSGGTFNGAPGRAIGVGNRVGGVGTATISGTALVKTEDLFIAGNDNTVTDLGGTGTLNINGGELQVNDDFIVGNYGNGTLNMTGGLVSKSGYIVVGNNPAFGGNPASSGTFTMTGGTFDPTITGTGADFEVGDEGTGVADLSGGFFKIPGAVSVGNRRGGTGTLTVGGSAVLNAANLFVGGHLDEGVAATHGTGTLNVNGGTVAIGDEIRIGDLGNGTVTVNGGNLSLDGWIVLADKTGSTGTLNVSGGTVTQGGTFGDLEVGKAGTGTFNLSGGTVNVADAVVISLFAGSSGDANISGGTLTANKIINNSASSVDISGTGRVNIRPNGTADGMSIVKALSISDNGVLNLNDNDFIVDYGAGDPSPEFVLRDYVKAFADNPAATSGIDFTHGANDVTIAVAEKTEWGFSTFNGVTLDDTTIVGKYTYYGDSNLDGAVTSDDYVAVDVGLGSGDSWVQGDFNFSGSVTSDDYVAIDVNLGKGSPTPLAFAELKAEMVALHTAMFGAEYVEKLAYAEANGFGATMVPEPGALGLVGLAAAGLLGRRRRRQH